MRPKPIETKMPKSEANIKIYRNEVVFSEAAVGVLGLDEEHPMVACMFDEDAAMCGRMRIYLARIEQGWPLKYRSLKIGRRRAIRCRSLSRILAEKLNGFGTYRLCDDDFYTDPSTGIVWYNIFFRRYD